MSTKFVYKLYLLPKVLIYLANTLLHELNAEQMLELNVLI